MKMQNILVACWLRIARLTQIISTVIFVGTAGTACAVNVATLDELLDSVGLNKTFSEIRATVPNAAWQETTDKFNNRYYLWVDNGFSFSDISFSVSYTDGDSGAQELNGRWRGNGYTFDSCRLQMNSLVSAFEKRFGPFRAAPVPKGDYTDSFATVTFSTEHMGSRSDVSLRIEDISAFTKDPLSNYIEWRAVQLTNRGVELVVGGQFFGVATFRGQKNDCRTFFNMSDTKSKPRHVITDKIPVTIVQPQTKQ